MRREKKYKAVCPIHTVDRIRKILTSKLGLQLKEENFSEKNNLFFSTHLVATTDKLKYLQNFTNGKGMTQEFSLASAYAEFMERLQNSILFDDNYFYSQNFIDKLDPATSEYVKLLLENDLVLKYTISPDEVFVTEDDEIKSLVDRYVKSHDNERIIAKIAGKGVFTQPFFNVFNRRVEMLPTSILTKNIGSSGMCAGNTAKEAIIQGIGEIVERYSMRLIYQKNLTPPTIPKEEFRGNEIYDKIIALENNTGISIEIKDCSFGLNILPTIGVLITENNGSRYQFRLGVDPSPITALERCLTELFQGREDLMFFDIDIPYQTKMLHDIKLKEEEFKKSFISGVGQYPISLFYPTPSFNYTGFDLNLAKSDDEDLKYIVKAIEKEGFDLFVRDVSFLGFPSFRVFIPGMSELNNVFTVDHFEQTYMNQEYVRLYRIAQNPFEACDDDIDVLANYIEKSMLAGNTAAIDNVVNKTAWSTMNKYFLIAILCFRHGQVDRAERFMQTVINQNAHSDLIQFFKCCISLMSHVNNDTINIVKSIYGDDNYELANAVLFSDNGLAYFKFSSCFDCGQCKIKNSCQFIAYAKLLKTIETEYMNNLPNQNSLFDTLS